MQFKNTGKFFIGSFFIIQSLNMCAALENATPLIQIDEQDSVKQSAKQDNVEQSAEKCEKSFGARCVLLGKSLCLGASCAIPLIVMGYRIYNVYKNCNYLVATMESLDAWGVARDDPDYIELCQMARAKEIKERVRGYSIKTIAFLAIALTEYKLKWPQKAWKFFKDSIS